MDALLFRLHNTCTMLDCKRLLPVTGGCPVRWIPVLALSAAFPLGPSILAQSLQNAQFQLAYSPSGITSLKHVQDKYDTDYIAGGRTVGEVIIRYRAIRSEEHTSELQSHSDLVCRLRLEKKNQSDC